MSVRVSIRSTRALVLAATLTVVPHAFALPTTSVVAGNYVGLTEDPAARLVDSDGTPLSAGTSRDGDGAVVALGYFTAATAAAPFAGNWIPLTGPSSANYGLGPTTVGDSESGHSGPYGFFTFQRDFDEANPAVFQHIPEAGQQLALAVYNGSTVTDSTRFNIATNPAWRWQEPVALPAAVTLDLNATGTLWYGGVASAFATTVPTAVFPGWRPPARLVNLSTRGWVGGGDQQLITGFVIDGSGAQPLLIRGAGPTMATDPFNVKGVLPDPGIHVVRQQGGVEMAFNDDWSGDTISAMLKAGAFGFVEGSRDAATVIDLPASPGGYTAAITGANGGTGIALAEIYDVGSSTDAPIRLVNLSTRGFVGQGERTMIAGFVLGSGGPRRLLLRAVGPTLGAPPFNVPGVLADPILRVYSIDGDASTPVAVNDDWSDDPAASLTAAAASRAGAFPLPSGSGDAALVFEIPSSGARGYTIQVAGADGGIGIVLTEIYELP